MPDDKAIQPQNSTRKRGYLSSIISTFVDTVHMQICASLDMRRLAKERERNRLIAALINSETEISKAKTGLETTTSYTGPTEIVKAKASVELAQLESEKQLLKAQKGRDQAKHEVEKENNAEYRERKEQERVLLIEESIARISASIHTYQLKGSDSQASPTPREPTAEDRRNEDKKQMDERAKKIEMIDTWQREELLKLDEQKRQELAELEAAPWTTEEKKSKKYEIEARLARRKEEILTTAPNMEKGHG